MSTLLTSSGKPAIPLTEHQKYVFDTQGWLAIPGVLSEAELQPLRDHMEAIAKDPESLPPTARNMWGGPLAELLDHPQVVGILDELVANGDRTLGGEHGYPFRAEGGFATRREKGHDNWSPHGGGGYFRFPANSHTYHMQPGRVNAGLTRIVWELNAVEHGRGGTAFVSGSHKAAYPLPPEVKTDREHPIWSTYGCPGGTLLVFTEAITHTGTTWDLDHPRMATFCCYNTIGNRFHGNTGPSAEQLAAMPPLRQSLFRDAWVWDPTRGEGASHNDRYTPPAG